MILGAPLRKGNTLSSPTQRSYTRYTFLRMDSYSYTSSPMFMASFANLLMVLPFLTMVSSPSDCCSLDVRSTILLNCISVIYTSSTTMFGVSKYCIAVLTRSSSCSCCSHSIESSAPVKLRDSCVKDLVCLNKIGLRSIAAISLQICSSVLLCGQNVRAPHSPLLERLMW